MGRRRQRLGLLGGTVAFAVSMLAILAPPVAKGCAICAEIPGVSGELGPRLLEVASAIRHELDSGGLEPRPGAPLPTSGRGLGLRMARLLSDQPERNHSFELILIDSGARFRFDPAEPERGLVPIVTKEETRSSAMRWITGLEVFHALLEGSIQIDTAEVRGVLVIEALSAAETLGLDSSRQADSGPELADAEKKSPGTAGHYGSAVLVVILGVLILMPVVLLRRSIRRSQAQLDSVVTK